MVLLDNSEYMRNGDYIPSRLEAQQDAANLIVGAKTQSHPESTVGVSAGTELLVSPTDDVGKILNALHGLRLHNKTPDVTASMQVASLALKHRRNKNGAQRIVLFVGSPLTNMESRQLTKAGRALKKNNISIDVVAMGELEGNEEKLRELVDAANGRSAASADGGDSAERTCHLVTIPAGVLPSDVLASSPVIHGSGEQPSAFAASATAGAPAGGMGGDFGGFEDFGGVDPNMDPELAMALRVSMEEERARQERVAAAASEEQETKDADMTDAAATSEGKTGSETAASAAGAAMDMGLTEEEALLQQALAMSMNENDPVTSSEEESKQINTDNDKKPSATENSSESDSKDKGASNVAMETDDVDEDAAMQLALQMSMQVDTPADTSTSKNDATGTDGTQQLQDPSFVNELLGSLPGVDPSDPAIQNAIRNIGKDEKDKDNEKDSKK